MPFLGPKRDTNYFPNYKVTIHSTDNVDILYYLDFDVEFGSSQKNKSESVMAEKASLTTKKA